MLVQGMARGLCSVMHTPKAILAPQPLLPPPDKNLGQLDKDKPSSSPATAVVASEGCAERGAWCHRGAAIKRSYTQWGSRGITTAPGEAAGFPSPARQASLNKTLKTQT